ncbi:DUF6417 family protein [Streptomyces sp. NPDC088794]|uniref:DUF6417 family protein n=1 Tax=Streptomyces sp. NPDC088794 TaxID=3365902 RepID=UPI00381FB34C
MGTRDERLAALELLGDGERAARHTWVVDGQAPDGLQQSVERLVSDGLAELAGRETRAELSVLLARPVRWAARLTPYGRDALIYARALSIPVPEGDEPASGERRVELQPAQMEAVRRFTSLAQLSVGPAAGLAERVRTATFSRTENRWRLVLTEEQIASVAYGLHLHRLTGSVTEANRFAREYDVVYRPCPDTRKPTAARLSRTATSPD